MPFGEVPLRLNSNLLPCARAWGWAGDPKSKRARMLIRFLPGPASQALLMAALVAGRATRSRASLDQS